MDLRRYLLIACAGGMTMLAAAQGAPDMSGSWVLNTKRGENLGMVAALEQTLVVTQSDARLVLDFTNVFQGNASERHLDLDLTGAAAENPAAMGDPSTTESNWEGERLVTKWTTASAIPGEEVIRIETHELAADGAELHVTTERDNRPTMVLIYERP